MDTAHIINGFIKVVYDNALPFATAMAAIGVLSMAVIQTAKDMFPIRNYFHRHYLKTWLRKKAWSRKIMAEEFEKKEQQVNIEIAEADLIRLATAGDAEAFYDLPIEQLCAQVNAATQVVLDYPADHQDLLTCLASQASASDLYTISKTEFTDVKQPKGQEEIDARARVIHQVQRSIDGLQIAAGFRWKFYVQLASFAASFLLTIIGLSFQQNISAVLDNLSLIVFMGIVGGFLAPVARDLVASIQKLRA